MLESLGAESKPTTAVTKEATLDPTEELKKKKKSDKYMVLQMGQNNDDNQDQMLIQYLSQNALAI
jgi:hypothetical protein